MRTPKEKVQRSGGLRTETWGVPQSLRMGERGNARELRSHKPRSTAKKKKKELEKETESTVSVKPQEENGQKNTTDLFTVSILLPFPECHIVGIIQYGIFSYCLLSLNNTHISLLSNMHLSLFMLDSSFRFSAE